MITAEQVRQRRLDRKRSRRLKKPICSSGNKLCGGRCIPESQSCKVGKDPGIQLTKAEIAQANRSRALREKARGRAAIFGLTAGGLAAAALTLKGTEHSKSSGSSRGGDDDDNRRDPDPTPPPPPPRSRRRGRPGGGGGGNQPPQTPDPPKTPPAIKPSSNSPFNFRSQRKKKKAKEKVKRDSLGRETMITAEQVRQRRLDRKARRSKPNCSAGNTACGQICIPKSSTCRKTGGKKKVSKRRTKSRRNNLNELAVTGLSAAALASAAAVFANQSSKQSSGGAFGGAGGPEPGGIGPGGGGSPKSPNTPGPTKTPRNTGVQTRRQVETVRQPTPDLPETPTVLPKTVESAQKQGGKTISLGQEASEKIQDFIGEGGRIDFPAAMASLQGVPKTPGFQDPKSYSTEADPWDSPPVTPAGIPPVEKLTGIATNPFGFDPWEDKVTGPDNTKMAGSSGTDSPIKDGGTKGRRPLVSNEPSKKPASVNRRTARKARPVADEPAAIAQKETTKMLARTRKYEGRSQIAGDDFNPKEVVASAMEKVPTFEHSASQMMNPLQPDYFRSVTPELRKKKREVQEGIRRAKRIQRVLSGGVGQEEFVQEIRRTRESIESRIQELKPIKGTSKQRISLERRKKEVETVRQKYNQVGDSLARLEAVKGQLDSIPTSEGSLGPAARQQLKQPRALKKNLKLSVKELDSYRKRMEGHENSVSKLTQSADELIDGYHEAKEFGVRTVENGVSNYTDRMSQKMLFMKSMAGPNGIEWVMSKESAPEALQSSLDIYRKQKGVGSIKTVEEAGRFRAFVLNRLNAEVQANAKSANDLLDFPEKNAVSFMKKVQDGIAKGEAIQQDVGTGVANKQGNRISRDVASLVERTKNNVTVTEGPRTPRGGQSTRATFKNPMQKALDAEIIERGNLISTEISDRRQNLMGKVDQSITGLRDVAEIISHDAQKTGDRHVEINGHPRTISEIKADVANMQNEAALIASDGVVTRGGTVKTPPSILEGAATLPASEQTRTIKKRMVIARNQQIQKEIGKLNKEVGSIQQRINRKRQLGQPTGELDALLALQTQLRNKLAEQMDRRDSLDYTKNPDKFPIFFSERPKAYKQAYMAAIGG